MPTNEATAPETATEAPEAMTYAEQYHPVWVCEVLDLADRL